MYGKYHGKGVYTLAAGTKYRGEFKLGKYHGKGVLISPDGVLYEGEFADDK